MDKKDMENLLVGYFVFEKIKKAMNTGLGIIIAVIMWFVVLVTEYINRIILT